MVMCFATRSILRLMASQGSCHPAFDLSWGDMMFRTYYVLAASLVICGASVPAVAQGLSCTKLDQVVAASTSSFRSISAPDPRDDSSDPDMKPAIFLPGAQRCYVSVDDTGLYTCAFKTAATLQGSTVWGPTHLGYLVEQFQKWVAGCGGYTGNPQYLNHKRFDYKGRYPIIMSISLYWETGEFIVSLGRPGED